ncbi:hypothetical protein ACFL2T_07945, partial [Elusimicrobiota bacterium]
MRERARIIAALLMVAGLSLLALSPARAASWQSIMTEDFEGAFPTGLWSQTDANGPTNGEQYWDVTGFRFNNGANSAYCGQGGANGFPAPGPYVPEMRGWIIYGPFDLSDAVGAELNFWYWNDSQSGADYFKWLASVDGSYYFNSHSGNSGGWVYENFDLTNVPTLGDVTDHPEVWIAFKFDSD